MFGISLELRQLNSYRSHIVCTLHIAQHLIHNVQSIRYDDELCEYFLINNNKNTDNTMMVSMQWSVFYLLIVIVINFYNDFVIINT